MPIKFDGVIEAVRYAPNGKIMLVRAYERRGAIFSDHLLISRDSLVERLKKGDKFVIGQRKPALGNSFEIGAGVTLTGDVIATSASSGRDLLDPAPRF